MFRLSDSCIFIACLCFSVFSRFYNYAVNTVCMVSRAIWKNIHSWVFSKTSNCTRPSDSCNFDRLETMLLPIQIPIRLSFIFRAISSNSNEHKRFRALTDSWGLLLECRTKVFVSPWHWNRCKYNTVESSIFAKIQFKKSFETTRSWHDPGYLGIKVL
jgi:hypothetical protein